MQKNSIFREWILPVVIALGVAFLINNFLIYNVEIPSESMVPTLNVGDKLMISRVFNTENITRGEILVFNSDELDEKVIKRVIGIPGDHIKILNGIVNVNGCDLEENYVQNNEYNEDELVFDVPENKFFFLGDNRAISNDSRRWINPYIDKSDIEGKAVLKFYPLKDFGSVK